MKQSIFIIIFMIFLSFFLYSQDDLSNDPIIKFEFAKMKHESENPAFSQKGGMIRPGEHSFYLSTNDEWTGFSTVMIGYRFGVSKAFNIAVEGGVSVIPHVYLASVLMHFKIFESKNGAFFAGTRIRFGYKYQDNDFSSATFWGGAFGEDYLTVKRNGLYLATDFTVAFRPDPKYRRHCIYYSFYPKLDIDFFDRDMTVIFMFAPVMIGYEVRFPKRGFRWTFAAEAGYVIPIPWNLVPAEKWVNFPCLANVTFSYRIGDKFYSKKNIKEYGLEKLPTKKQINEKMKEYKKNLK